MINKACLAKNIFQIPLISLLMTMLFSAASWANKAPIQVIGYQVEKVSIPQNLKVLGSLKAQQSTDLAFSVSDTLNQIHVTSGQMVKQGQLLFELNHSEQLALLEQARALEKEALAQYRRVKKAISRTSVTQSLLDERYRQWQTAAAQRKIYQQQIAERKLYAPFDGQLGLINLSIGQVVDSAEKLASLDNTQKMRLNFMAPSYSLTSIQPDLKLEVISDAFDQHTFSGKVIAVSPQLNPISRLVAVQAEIDNQDGLLKTNMLVEANITLPAKPQLQVPNSSLLMIGDKVFVYRLIAKESDSQLYKAEKITVEIGDIDPQFTEILSGLNKGDIVVSQGVMRVNSKTDIQVKALQNNRSQSLLLKPMTKAN